MLSCTEETEGELLSDEALQIEQAKAEKYASEPERVTPFYFEYEMRAENGNHLITYDDGKWACTCDFFGHHQTCCHVMAVGRMLKHLPIVQPRGNMEDTEEIKG